MRPSLCTSLCQGPRMPSSAHLQLQNLILFQLVVVCLYLYIITITITIIIIILLLYMI